MDSLIRRHGNSKTVFVKSLKGIIVGGPGATKDFFIEKDYIHHELKKIVIDTFETGYTDEYGLSEVVEKASTSLSKLAIMKEKKLIQKFMTEIKKDRGGLSVYGEEPIRHALQLGAVDTILISEDLRQVRRKYNCTKCGNIEEKSYKVQPGVNDEEKLCDKCSSTMDKESEIDIVDDLSQMADETGTKIELISGDSSEGEMLLKAFGGMAGILRFRVKG